MPDHLLKALLLEAEGDNEIRYVIEQAVSRHVEHAQRYGIDEAACPICAEAGTHIAEAPREADGDTYTQHAACARCGAEWVYVYTIDRLVNLRLADGTPVTTPQ